MIGPAGGTLAMPDGPTLVFPRAALDADTMITITRTTETLPGGVTPLYTLEPEGLVFAQPITATIPTAAGDVSVYWSVHNGTGYEAVGGHSATDGIAAEQVHFSGLYAGSKASSRTVSGSEIVTYVRASGIKNQAIDLSALAPEILVTQNGGAYTMLPGAGSTDGSFSVPGVPDGTYVLALGNHLYVTDAEAFDGGQMAIGRPDATVSTQPSTTAIDINITNMDPFTPGDMIEGYSSEVDMWWFELADQLAPAQNDTALVGTIRPDMALTSNAYFGVINQPRYLIDGAAGDRLNIAQLHTKQTGDGVEYLALTKAFAPAPFTQVDSGTTTVTGAFSDVSATNTVTMDYRGTQFAQAIGFDGTHCSALHPAAVPLVSATGIVAEPITSDFGAFGANADLVFVRRQVGDPDVLVNNATYGSPTLGTWAPMLYAKVACIVHVALSTGADAPFVVSSGLTDDIAAYANPVVPKLGPIGAPTVGGVDAWQPLSGVGTTPHVAWTAPALGTATHYNVLFWHLVLDGVDTGREQVLEMSTTDTHVDVPPGYLMANEKYVIEIRADQAPKVAAPNRSPLQTASSRIVTSVLTL